ncbi:hypothetical protein ACQKJC_00720 [Priestia koreensis]|uniref:hypothetical protein n=1 Tax=Priestia koreensis TaxID=284581 RepID=UPI003CFFACD7
MVGFAVVWFIILLLVCFFVFSLLKDKTKKTKRVIWGLMTMFVIAPLLSGTGGMILAASSDNGIGGGALMMLLFPLLFLIGFLLLGVGLLKK